MGARRPDRINVRIIAATNTPLQELVRNDEFREDLYYRLKILSLRIPPLRDRPEDILPLCRYFARQYAQERNTATPTFTDAVLNRLHNYDWPGNVRELKHLVRELLVFSRGEEITLEMLPPQLRKESRESAAHPLSLSAMEKKHIHTICVRTGWNITQAAKLLGIGRQTLYRKLNQYQLEQY